VNHLGFRDDDPVPSDTYSHRWEWKNLRDMGITIGVWPINWHFGIANDADQFGGALTISIGPLDIAVHYSVGQKWKSYSKDTSND
jgi:hypothetical protein